MKKRQTNTNEPTIAPTFDGDESKKDASEEEVSRGDYTEVVTLSFDEVDPSEGKNK
ncbi:hypothetical protein [Risungbinella massiliensis]|uniref:hypothetical protein n=1 Tax=Risungbinella massiliensis TaxID=1329796 RepID=UPI00164E12B0|nr:hypothetical protein [Risungbinella massiliensis]